MRALSAVEEVFGFVAGGLGGGGVGVGIGDACGTAGGTGASEVEPVYEGGGDGGEEDVAFGDFSLVGMRNEV